MALVSIKRPAIENLDVPRDRLRVQQHTSDNIDYINQAFAQVELSDCVHGVEQLIPNPYGASSTKFPSAVLSSYAVTTAGVAQTIGTITISPPRTDNQIGITVQYARSWGERMEVVLTGATAAVPNGGTIVVSWNGQTTYCAPGTAMSWSAAAPTLVTIAEPGLYLVNLQAAWAVSATGGRTSQVARNGATVWGSAQASDPFIGDTTHLPLSAFVTCAAGDTISANCGQSSGGALSMVGGGSLTAFTSFRTAMQVTRIQDTSVQTATVTAVLIAGN